MSADEPVIHVALPDQDGAACQTPTGVVIDWAEATGPGGRHFTCVECHKVVSGGDRHVAGPS